MTDVTERLRAADPCPAPVAYDDAVAQRNIDTIVRTDLTVGEPASALPRGPGTKLAFAAVVVALIAAGSLLGVEIARDTTNRGPIGGGGASGAPVAWITFSTNGITFEHPEAWKSYPPGPASAGGTSSFADLSTLQLPEPCVYATHGDTESMNCRTPVPDLSGGGTFVEWSTGGLPGAGIDGYGGASTTIAGFQARVDRSAPPQVCGGSQAVAGVLAAIAAPRNSLLTMIACVGPGDVDADLAAVDRMLSSLKIEN